jgi:hypothetical protein
MRKIFPSIEYLNLDMSILDIKMLIYEKIKYAFKDSTKLKTDKDINLNIMIHIYENLPLEKVSNYHSRRAVCEFCEEKHG